MAPYVGAEVALGDIALPGLVTVFPAQTEEAGQVAQQRPQHRSFLEIDASAEGIQFASVAQGQAPAKAGHIVAVVVDVDVPVTE